MNSAQSNIASAGAVMPCCFEMLQECRDVRDGELFDCEFGDVAIAFNEELQKEFDTVTITAKRVRAEGPLPGQVVDEEAM
jgi:hypothetical protein